MNTEKKLTGYPSIDKPWLKYYSDEAVNSPLPECSLYEYMYTNNVGNKKRYALSYFGQDITFNSLFRCIDEVAKAFIAQGVKKGDIVSIISLSTATSIICFYAINKIGAVSDFLNVLSSEEDLSRFFVDSKSKIAVTLDLFAENVQKAAMSTEVNRIIVFSLGEYTNVLTKRVIDSKMKHITERFTPGEKCMSWKQFLKSGKNQKEIFDKKDPHTLCFLAHTGGTTGFPKSVLLNDCQMNAVAHQYNLCMSHETGETFLNCIVPFVVYGILVCLHMPLSLGLKTVVIPKFEASDWRKYFLKYKPIHIAGIPSYITPMLSDEQLSGLDLSFLKTLAVGGDGMNEQYEMDINAFLKNHNANTVVTKGYGMTELCATAVTEYAYCNKVGSVGIPLVKCCVQIYDNDTKKEMQFNQMGEICFSSPSLMIGYKNNIQEEENLIRIHQNGEKWVHTGDLGYMDSDGFLFIKGRMKRWIFLGPEGMLYKVFPKNIEELICSIADVKDACVVSAICGKNLVAIAYVITAPTSDSNTTLENEIISFCNEKLPDYMVPHRIIFVESFPMTSIGKVDYRALEKMAEEMQ